MKKSSVFQITLLAVFAALGVAGILIFALAVGGGNANAIGPIKIWGTLDKTAFTTVLRQVADEDPNFNQVSYVQKDPSTYESEITNALASGEGPDLFLMTQDHALQNAGKTVVIPSASFSRSQFENTFASAAGPFISTQGALALPLVIDPLVLYWNKDMLASAGFASPPQYWDELFSFAASVSTKDDAGSIQRSAVAFGEYKNVDHAKDILAMLIMQAGGHVTTRDSSGRLQSDLVAKGSSASSASAVAALRFYTEFADPSKDDYSWNRSLPQAQQAFAAGDLALYVGYASEESAIRSMNPNLNFGVAAMPQIRAASDSQGAARVYALAASRTSVNPAGALSVAATLTSSTNSALFAQVYGIPSARRDLLNAATKGSSSLAARMAIIARSWEDPDPAQTDDVFRAMIENTTSGALLINEAISRADQQLVRILNTSQPEL